MKKIFENKLNILLIILLLASIGALGFFSYNLIFEDKKISVPDFSKATENDVNKWCNSLENNPCVITKEYSDKVEKDHVIYQSLSEGQTLDNNISIVISLGKNVEIELIKIDKNTTKEDVEKWASNNGLKNIKYINENSDTVEKGNVISIKPEKITNTDTEITVLISLGVHENSDDEIIVNYEKYVDLSEKDFISKTKALGLKPSHASEKDMASSSIEEGRIVWHGSGTFEKDEVIRYGLSLGISDDIVVQSGDFVGLTYEEFETKVKQMGLVPKHNENRTDGYSEEINENCILWHGSGTYVKGENITYTLSKGSESGEIVIKSGDYIGLDFDEFKQKVEKLGLVTKHNTNHNDEYSSTIKKNGIIWHGSGTYVKGEAITYALSKGPSENGEIIIERGDFVGLTYAEFEKKVKALGLVPEHSEVHSDDPSDTIPKGSIDWHGSGTYVDGEVIHYTLSLGKQNQESTQDTITIESYKGKSESDFKKYISSKGLSLGTRTSQYSDSISEGYIISNDTSVTNKVNYVVSMGKDTRVDVSNYVGKSETDLTGFLSANGLKGFKIEEYSSSVAQGKIISNDTGKFDSGSTVNYKVSLGEKMYHINNFDVVAAKVEKTSFEETKAAVEDFFKGIGFTNVTVTSQAAQVLSPGRIISISVDGNTSALPGDFGSDVEIIIKVCNKTLN